jgi:hypothetical protein
LAALSAAVTAILAHSWRLVIGHVDRPTTHPERALHWLLKIGCAMCFIGHGAWGVITKQAGCPSTARSACSVSRSTKSSRERLRTYATISATATATSFATVPYAFSYPFDEHRSPPAVGSHRIWQGISARYRA